MEQTIKEWFDTIEDPEIKAKAIANTDPYIFNEKTSSLEGSLQAAFSWSDSPEKHKFWFDFTARLNNK
jgi:transcription elongation factor GreA-like protein